jgi:hypothetical protein
MPEAMKGWMPAMTWNASQALWSTERILDFLLKAGQPWGKYQLPVECRGLRLDLP